MLLRIPSVRAFAILVLGFAFTVLSGCASSIPDITPFRNGTAALRDATKSSYDETYQAVKEVKDRLPSTATGQNADLAAANTLLQQNYDDTLDYLSKLRDLRLAVLDGMVAYAAELDRSAKAGEGEIARVAAASKIAEGIINQVGAEADAVSAGAGGLVAQGATLFIDAARKAHDHFVILNTNKSLLDRMQANEKAVDDLADGLEKDLKLLSDGLGPLGKAADKTLRAEATAQTLYDTRKNLTATLHANPAPTDAQVVDIEKNIAVIDTALAPVDEERATTAHAFVLTGQMIASAQKALTAWRDEHKNLKDAVVANNTLDSDELDAAVKEIQDEIQRFKDFSDKVAASRKKPAPAKP